MKFDTTNSLLAFASGLAIATCGLSTAAHAEQTTPPNTAANAQDAQDEFKIQFRADTLVVTPVISVGLVNSAQTVVAGEDASFLAYNNYPSFVEKGEIRIFKQWQSPDAEPMAVVSVDGNGTAQWRTAQDMPSDLFFKYRVYDSEGRFDETEAHELILVKAPLAGTIEDNSRPDFGRKDEASRRNLDLKGMMVTASGQATTETDVVRVNGQLTPIDQNGKWVAQQIVAREKSGMNVAIERNGKEVKHVTQTFAVPKQDWFVIGQGDLTLGKSFGNGPAEEVSGYSLAQGDFAIGRAAFYAKGVVGDDVRVTASVDTGETLVKDLFSNLDRKDPRQLLRRLDREQYYPTYGDDSTLVEDAPTQGRFYLRVNKAESQLVIGNFTTTVNGAELAQLDRGLFGALVDYNSKGTTSFGERTTQITAFASDPGTVPGREEFRGTGGSLYFLKRQDVSVGSERVRVEIRDRETGIVLESHDLHPQEDYDFDSFQGRLMLLKPLASTAANGGVVRESSSTGNVPVLVVRYEYSPPVGSLDGYTVGGRTSHWFADKVRIGATAQRDTVEEASQTLLGADALLRLAAGTYVKAEIAQTDGPGFGQSNSVDGGLSFTDIANPGSAGKAIGWRTELALDFAEMAKNPAMQEKFRPIMKIWNGALPRPDS